MKRPLILVTNDDGITAPGIAALVEVARQFGDVVVVAPDSPQSGMGHAITIGEPLRMHTVKRLFGDDVPAWQTNGTPVDCVKLASNQILPRKPDLCVSGVNHGSNCSINVIYSGTMSAAMEAYIEGIPAIGFSLLDYSYAADFTLAKYVAYKMIDWLLTSKQSVLLNVNIPKASLKEFKGIRFCRQAKAKWMERFDKRTDPSGKDYYWMLGEFKNLDEGTDTDVYALEHMFASVVPIQFDLTNYSALEQFQAMPSL